MDVKPYKLFPIHKTYDFHCMYLEMEKQSVNAKGYWGSSNQEKTFSAFNKLKFTSTHNVLTKQRHNYMCESVNNKIQDLPSYYYLLK